MVWYGVYSCPRCEGAFARATIAEKIPKRVRCKRCDFEAKYEDFGVYTDNAGSSDEARVMVQEMQEEVTKDAGWI